MLEAPALPVAVEGAGGGAPHVVCRGIDRPRSQGAQLMVGGEDGAPRAQRFGHSDRPGRHPLRYEPLRDAGSGAVDGCRPEGSHDVTPVGATVCGKRDDSGEAVLVEHSRAAPGNGAWQLQGSSDGQGLALPAHGQVTEVGAGRFGRTRRRPGGPCAAGRAHAPFVPLPPDVGAPAGERPQQLGADPDHLRRPARAARPAHPEGSRHARPQAGFVDGSRGGAVGMDPPPVRGAPATVGPVDEVGQHHVAVQVGVAIAAHPVREDSRHRAAGGHHSPCRTRPAGGGEGVPLEIRDRAGHGLFVRVDYRLRHLGSAQPEQDAG